jgi:catechol 2,3-dioxygenase-like lactoylglutathione lyase family enzyme
VEPARGLATLARTQEACVAQKTKKLARTKKDEQDVTEPPAPRINVRFLYSMCNDVKVMRAFFTDVLGMKELSFRDDENFGWVVYDTEGLQLMFFRWDGQLQIEARWAWQPGEAPENAAPLMSFSIEYPEEDLRTVVKRVREAVTPAATEKPTWRQNSYWGWTVRDPMGNTIELYSSVSAQPKEGVTPEWTD